MVRAGGGRAEDDAAEVDRLAQMPWSRVVVPHKNGKFVARIRELPGCTAIGATPAEAFSRLEDALTDHLHAAIAAGAPITPPRPWDPDGREPVTLRLPSDAHRELLRRADVEAVTGPELARRILMRDLAAHERNRGSGPLQALLDDLPRVGRSGIDRVVGAVTRAGLPHAERGSDQWQRVVLNRVVGDHLTSLEPGSRRAAEISGDSHADRGWKSYRSLDYPEFDLCAPVSRDLRFDVVICEQVLEHVPEPNVAARNLRELCAPGGHVVVTTPFLIRVHELPELVLRDYWRFTPRGLGTLLEQAGLAVDAVGAWGNRFCVLGNLAYWPSYRRWLPLHNEPDVPVQVWAFARNAAD